MIRAAAVAAALLGTFAQDGRQTVSKDFLVPGDTRSFAIAYTGQVSQIPAGTKKLRVWLPVPQDSTVQSIKDLKFSRDVSFAVETKYGNRIAYAEIENPGPTVEITMSFVCTRAEIKSDLKKLAGDGNDPADSFKVFRGPDSLVLVDDEMKKLSDGIVKGRADTLEKARAIYDYVLEKMAYDKNHEGWGRGSTRHACDVGKGNCTDFHALFMSLARAEGIATGFEIGLYGPYGRHSTEALGGYHCWSWFKVPGGTWVPVDISEADRFADRYEFLFGNQTANRIALAVGRDLVLEPRQAGEPLNYLLNPHAEADGKAVPTSKDWTLKDLDPK
jgi:transglutaminase-like putative cysteine protease